ncbi:hypothetical protein [Nostoc sp. FACHB-190]|uniref:hypothetical protein n=1 Tax=Nostoc sp. FACHB-190 TaxID=2692838 RepID=UPI0016872C35|nr:hypothetical protein [Nostoc sp. FACHB-190]
MSRLKCCSFLHSICWVTLSVASPNLRTSITNWLNYSDKKRSPAQHRERSLLI